MSSSLPFHPSMLLGILALLASPNLAAPEDWPEWRGAGRLGVWNETGILDAFPDDGLEVTWRTTVGSGYAGPSVANGRVFLTDFSPTDRNQGFERIVCLDEATGEILWEHAWEVDYTGLQLVYAIGPRATPTVDGDRVYVLGAMGRLLALTVDHGKVLWEKDFVRDYEASVPVWGMPSAPIVDGERVIALAAGEPNAKVVAFHRDTGREIWRALSSDWEPGYSQPVFFEAGGERQLLIWHPRAMSSLDPVTGRVYWEAPFIVSMGMTVSTPIVEGRHLFVSSFYDGARMWKLDEDGSGVTLLWESSGDSEVRSDKIHTLLNTAVIRGDYLYGVDSYGQMRCLEIETGRRMWETMAVTREKQRWAAAFFVRHGDRYFINNDRGELIIAKLSPEGFQELDRTQLIEPTSPTVRRRDLGAVHWSHPAYANRHILVRNDREILRASLAKTE